MQTVYKYTLEVTDDQIVMMPADAKVLYLAVQNGVPRIWALVDPDKVETPRRFRLYGTGHGIRHPVKEYVGSFMVRAESLVFHVWEV